MATQHKIDPSGIVSPTQLLAAVLVLLLVVVPALITGAATVDNPSWAAGLFVIAAVAYVPLVLVALFLLLTKYRLFLLGDQALVRLGAQARELAPHVSSLRTAAGFDIEALVGHTTRPKDPVATEELRKQTDELVVVVDQLRARDGFDAVPSEALLESAKGLMVQHRWKAAARYFDEYVKHEDSDWQVHFSRGVAHANSRTGESSDISAVRAYSDALALAPPDADPNLIARLLTYRAAMNKRRGRLLEAEVDLALAESKATRRYEIVDLLYNKAAVFAMMSRKEESLEAIRRLKELGALQLVRPRVGSYFKSLSDDPEFLRILGDEPSGNLILVEGESSESDADPN